MQKPIPPRRDFRQMEQRRKRAARRFAAGKLSLAEIARELQVSRQSVSLPGYAPDLNPVETLWGASRPWTLEA